MIAKVKNARYDGYRLTYGGLDYLALNTHRKGNVIYSLGNQIGVGKESDIYVCASQTEKQLVLKLHRLGRISFRTVKANRDYLRNRSTGSWMYLSRLAAQKEHAFMRVLHREGFPVPEPMAWSRHTVVMEFIDAYPMRQIDSVPDPGKLYAELMAMIVSLAQRGLIHGDFNEFNILIKESPPEEEKVTLTPILIDFPQTMSTSHMNAEYYFDRDVACIKRYFERRFQYTSDEPGPFFKDAIKNIDPERRLDVEVEATGFSRKMAKELDRYVEATGGDAEEADQNLEDQEDPDGEDVEDVEDEEGQEEVEDGLAGGEPRAAEGDEAGAPPQDVQVDEPKLAEEIGSLTVEDDLAVKQPSAEEVGRRQNFAFEPLEISHDPDVVAEKVKTKKKKAGWAI